MDRAVMWTRWDGSGNGEHLPIYTSLRMAGGMPCVRRDPWGVRPDSSYASLESSCCRHARTRNPSHFNGWMYALVSRSHLTLIILAHEYPHTLDWMQVPSNEVRRGLEWARFFLREREREREREPHLQRGGSSEGYAEQSRGGGYPLNELALGATVY
ncbi:hypothetical protein LZ30DRAFT_149291 [Colletotrichum cereale]|nr:hypothetical protein LZ30DRAFT_149291 [Colletotrichum cereale]